MRAWRCAAATAGILIAAAALAGLLFVYSGAFSVAATQQHGWVVNWVLHTTALNSIKRRAENIVAPDLSDRAMIDRGLRLFRRDCVQCHGAPGLPPDDFAKGLMPGAPPLVQVAREWPAGEIYWTVAHGIKMTGMPAWEYRMDEGDIWALVAFVLTLPKLSPADYKAMAEKETEPPSPPRLAKMPEPDLHVRPGDAGRGKVALQQYACASCHVIPGIVAPQALVGPPLAGMGQRLYIAGILENTPRNMLLWLRDPQRVKPGTAMPDMGVAEQHGRDMVAYIEGLR